MAKTLKEILTPFSGTLTPEQKTSLESELDAFEQELRRSSAPAKPDPPAPGTTVAVLPPEVTQQIAALTETVAELAKSQKLVTSHVTTQEQQAQAAAKATSEKRYKDHVAKLLTDGKVSKADHDALLGAEKMSANMAALDVFIDSSEKWGVIPGFKGAPKAEDKDKPGQGAASTDGLTDAQRQNADLHTRALEELRNGMQG